MIRRTNPCFLPRYFFDGVVPDFLKLLPLPNYAKAAVITLFACMLWVSPAFGQDSGERNLAEHPDAQAQQCGSAVLARVGDVEIRQADVDNYIGHEVDDLTKRLYLLRNRALNSMIDSMLVRNEAARQHVDATQLLQREVKQHEPTTDEVDKEWSNNYESLHQLGEVAGRYQVVMELEAHANADELHQYLDRLRTRNHVTVLFEPPVVKLQARPGSNHFGNLNGAKELIVFQDYECPFCRSIEPEISSLLSKDIELSDVKVTIKQFPLSMHKGAFDAAVAAECAGQQGRFLPMHDLLITNQDHSKEGLAASASHAGLDAAKFRSCLAAGDAKTQVLLDMDEGRKNGVEGTPTLFLDGQAIDPPNGLEDLRKILDAKLKPRDETSSRLQEAPAADNQTRK